RFRLDGQLAELRARDLAFTEDEAIALFEAAGLTLDRAQVRALVRRAEGWAAALRFAALSLRRQDEVTTFVDAFAQTERAVSEYLVREVLARQAPDMRDFLLRTAICERVTAGLADAVTGRCDSEAVLASLERDNVFLERSEGWYRYHPLFRELLRAEARYAMNGELVEVHRAAARWLAANDDALCALHHAVAAGDAALAGELVADVWAELVGKGDAALAADLLEELPAAAIRGD